MYKQREAVGEGCRQKQKQEQKRKPGDGQTKRNQPRGLPARHRKVKTANPGNGISEDMPDYYIRCFRPKKGLK